MTLAAVTVGNKNPGCNRFFRVPRFIIYLYTRCALITLNSHPYAPPQSGSSSAQKELCLHQPRTSKVKRTTKKKMNISRYQSEWNDGTTRTRQDIIINHLHRKPILNPVLIIFFLVFLFPLLLSVCIYALFALHWADLWWRAKHMGTMRIEKLIFHRSIDLSRLLPAMRRGPVVQQLQLVQLLLLLPSNENTDMSFVICWCISQNRADYDDDNQMTIPRSRCDRRLLLLWWPDDDWNSIFYQLPLIDTEHRRSLPFDMIYWWSVDVMILGCW